MEIEVSSPVPGRDATLVAVASPGLTRDRAVVEQSIAAAITRAIAIATNGQSVEEQEDFVTWDQEREKSDASTVAMLRALFTDEALAEEFHDAATGAIFRNVSQGVDRTFESPRRP